MNDQYLPPASDVSQTEEYGDVSIFSPHGRFGRVRYLAHSAWTTTLIYGIGTLIVVGLTSASETLSGIAGLIMLLALFIVTFIFTIKRCHDFNASGWWSILVLIPLANLFFIFIPGTKGENRFGKKPPPNTKWLWAGAIVLPLFFIVGILAAIAIPAYQDYTGRAQIGDSMVETSAIKQTLAEYAQYNDGWPDEEALANLGLSEAKQTRFSLIYAHPDTGAVEVVMRESPPVMPTIANGTIMMHPEIENNVLKYTCSSDDIPPKFLPSSCK